MIAKIKTFLHPRGITWKSRKDTLTDSIKILAVVALCAMILLLGDMIVAFISSVLW